MRAETPTVGFEPLVVIIKYRQEMLVRHSQHGADFFRIFHHIQAELLRVTPIGYTVEAAMQISIAKHEYAGALPERDSCQFFDAAKVLVPGVEY
jgi:hypothetical protein